MIRARNIDDRPNQFVIYTDDKVIFQSYESVICIRDKATGLITLDEKYWDYSTTTGKYRNIFLCEDKKATEKKIKSGVYKLADLNED